MKLISSWSEKSIIYPTYYDCIELVYCDDLNVYYLTRHSCLGEILEKIELKPKLIYINKQRYKDFTGEDYD